MAARTQQRWGSAGRSAIAFTGSLVSRFELVR